jgi:transcriptional regulator with XRE-family HTH domain
LRAARDKAGLSQPELAKKLRKSQSMVAGAEAGRVRVGERYVAAVLRACKLPKDWKSPTAPPTLAPFEGDEHDDSIK